MGDLSGPAVGTHPLDVKHDGMHLLGMELLRAATARNPEHALEVVQARSGASIEMCDRDFEWAELTRYATDVMLCATALAVLGPA